MRKPIHAALIASLIAGPIAPLAAARLSPEARLAKLTEGRVAGKPVDCINPGMIGSSDSEKIPHIGMAYRQGTTWYVSRFQGGCPQLEDDIVVVTRIHGSNLCRGEIAELRMLPPDMPMGTCVFDSFVPYRKE